MEYEFKVDYAEHINLSTFTLDFYPDTKEASDGINYDEKAMPKSIHSVQLYLYISDVLVALSDPTAVDHEECTTISLELPNSYFHLTSHIVAKLKITSLDYINNIVSKLILPDTAEQYFVYPINTDFIDDVRVDSIQAKYSLKSKKISKVDYLTIDAYISNRSNNLKLAIFEVGGSANDEGKMISDRPSLMFANGFATEISLIEPNSSHKLSRTIFNVIDKLHEKGLPDLLKSDRENFNIFSYVYVFGNQKTETITLPPPNFDN